MGLITEQMKKLIEQQKLGYVATVSPDNTPNLSPKGTIKLWADDQLIFADIKSPKTMSNLEKNPSIEINIINPIARRGFRFKGIGKIISEGEEYEKIISQYKEDGIKSTIKRVVMIKIKTASEVTSPLYDLGYTEEEIKSKWKKHYLSF